MRYRHIASRTVGAAEGDLDTTGRNGGPSGGDIEAPGGNVRGNEGGTSRDIPVTSMCGGG